ncbi:MAG: insulinase family protein [Fimbriimonas ginsengisoli]|uniref:Insulinase family protein n=1 Tax=Fimbriimonas ginsengisoli TaxID=1005039 RepID=A0A931LUK9_FIMGI|nr:insulinase family protein [Fimbriimonas ginsengisoli]
MLVCLAALVLGPTAVDSAPRLRTILPNGVAILVERMPGAPLLSLQLHASSRYAPETKETHGYRHLLEHLVARGVDRRLDERLEAAGAFLTATTDRDEMRFELNLAPSKLDLGLASARELLEPLDVTPAQIESEAETIDQELALRDDSGLLAATAWSVAYGETGLDALGETSTIRTATPDALVQLQGQQFAAPCLAVTIAGDVDIDRATAAAKRIFGDLPSTRPTWPSVRAEGKAGRGSSAGFGEARGAIVGSFDEPSTAYVLVAAFALASEIEGSFVTYTPTSTRGLVVVGRTDQSSGVGLRADDPARNRTAALFQRGQALTRAWLRARLKSPSASARLRGSLLAQQHAARPEDLLEYVDGMSFDDYLEGLAAFDQDHAAIAVGSK